jgi:hypothetical protein
MRPPSSGGTGSRFSAIRPMLTKMPAFAISMKNVSATPSIACRFRNSAQPIAIARFAPGPAAATQIMSRFGRRKLPNATGTGLAQPNRNPGPPASFDTSRIAIGTAIVPIGSMCLTGLSVTRPAR